MIGVSSAYKDAWPRQARQLGGEWYRQRQLWIFPSLWRDRVIKLANDVYGGDYVLEEVESPTAEQEPDSPPSNTSTARRLIIDASYKSEPYSGVYISTLKTLGAHYMSGWWLGVPLDMADQVRQIALDTLGRDTVVVQDGADEPSDADITDDELREMFQVRRGDWNSGLGPSLPSYMRAVRLLWRQRTMSVRRMPSQFCRQVEALHEELRESAERQVFGCRRE